MAEPFEIVADLNERAHGSTFFKLLEANPEVKLRYERLEVGDYEIAPGVRVERKAAEDFTASIIDRRLMSAVKEAKVQGVSLSILLEGCPYSVGRLSDEAITGALSYLTEIEGVTIQQAPTARAAALMLVTMCRHRRDGLGYIINMRPPRPKSPAEQSVYLVSGLNGVGRGRAEALLEAFGTPAQVLSASVDQLMAVRGIGRKVAEEIRKQMDARYGGRR